MSLHNLDGIPPILDFEASSLSDTSYPISAGLVVAGKVHYWIIKPEPDWIDWSLQSQAIHGLSRSFIEAKGQPAHEVFNEICAAMEGHDAAYSDNQEWEKMWISRLGVAPFKIKDTAELLTPMYQRVFPIYRANTFKAHNLVTHRADHDALAIALTIKQLNN